jgi:hypothetical protein
MLTPVSPINQRAAVNVYNLSTASNTIQAWFFTESQAYFNVIHEQTFVLSNFDITQPLTLQYPPGNIEPVSQNTIIEITDNSGTRRLLPPDANYYSVTNTNHPVFSFTTTIQNNINVLVYLNGVALKPGFDYSVNTGALTVTIDTGSVSLTRGDAIAIESYSPDIIGNSDPLTTNYSYQYRIVGSKLYLSPRAGGTDIYTISSATLKVITNTDADGMWVESQKFVGNPNRRFTLNRPILNTNYVFVTVFKYNQSYPLVNGIDYIVLDDRVTVQLNDNWNLNKCLNIIEYL